MASSVEIILLPTLMILVGVVLKKLNILSEEDSSTLSKIVLNITLPSLIFINLSKATLNNELLILPITAIFIVSVTMIISYAYSKFMSYSKATSWTIIIASSMMNTAFIGYPVIMGVLGNEGFVTSIFYDMVIAVMFVVFGMILVSQFGGNRQEVFKNGITFIPLWAVIIGLLFNIFNIPLGYVLGNSLDYLSQATIPLIMLSLGLKINFSAIGDKLKDTIFILSLRLLIAPFIVLIFLKFFNVTGLIYSVAVLDSAMPIAMNALVLSITYDLDNQLMASVIFSSTVLCLITLPLFITLVI